MRFLCILLIAALPASAAAQGFYSIHRAELERHRDTPTTAALIGDRSQPIVPLSALAKSAAEKRTVFGYLPYWINQNDYQYLRYENLTHIAVFAVEVNPDGSLGNDHGWPWVNLINTAHANGVKVVLTATLFNSDDILTLISSRSNRDRFFSNIKNKILEGQADGVNIDFEGGGSNGWPGQINDFMAELTDYLHREIPGSEVSFAAPPVNWGNRFDLSGLAASCDYLFIMGYAFSGSWSTVSGANAPLTGGSKNITTTVTEDYAAVTRNMPEKLILGVPYYGHHWKTATAAAYSTVTASIGPVFFFSAQPESETYGKRWDTVSQTPWYAYNDGSSWNQVWFDDDSSLGLKYDLALAHDYRGVGMWALGYDAGRQELWELLQRKIGTTQDLPPQQPGALAVHSRLPNSLDVMFEPARRAEGYFVYYGTQPQALTDSVFFEGTQGSLTGLETGQLYFITVRATNAAGLSPATQVLPARPGARTTRVLLVDGFDRQKNNRDSHRFIQLHAQALLENNTAFSSASNEAIASGLLSLRNFQLVDWILGDESTLDVTFSGVEQDSVEAYLQSGGGLFVSGSEIGWDLVEKGSISDQVFYRDFLKATYLDDAPEGRKSSFFSATAVAGTFFEPVGTFDFDDGSHGSYSVDWPDAIAPAMGSSTIALFGGTDIGAGVAFSGRFPGGSRPGKLIYLSIPFETVYPAEKRTQMMAIVLDFFNIAPEQSQPAGALTVLQNFPNPFSEKTEIQFAIETPGQVSFTVFDILGRQVFSDIRQQRTAGWSSWIWQGRDMQGRRLASGRYFVRMKFTSETGKTYQHALAVTIVR
ncbi:MAG TPA: T9SS type A sorting domain-containing protein [Bacteroidetes bacterium]|nr:T9SS type A sorting domain-containing protein [Bacteroidota bacterium]